MSLLQRTLKSIAPVNRQLTPSIQAHLDDLTKPQGSLGRIEDLAMQYCLATHSISPCLGKMRVYCFAGDHGVADEGVSAFPKAVTPQMVLNMLGGGAAINIFTRHVGAELRIVDMGVDADFGTVPGLINCKVKRGTANMTQGPAMTLPEVTQALECGIRLAAEAASEGVTLLGTGEMGIANTTPATALFAAYLGMAPGEITGRGTGITEEGLRHKQAVIEKALTVNPPNPGAPLETLANLGGFEMAGITGLILGAAAHHIPVVVDGFISSAAALAAIRIQPDVESYLFFSHLSQERGHRAIMDKLSIRPILDLNLRLGEGTGAALAMGIVAAAIKMYNEMATFSSAHISNRDK
jgi:nicotinate-nucleotide--dimethylbenzimidazole phosphoribosyltransferase